MFCFFYENVFVGFWGNKIGDVFAELTCKSMRWDSKGVDLVFYHNISNIPEHYEFDSNKNLIIKKKNIQLIETESLDEQGNPIVTTVEEVSFETERVLECEVYYAKGLIVKAC